MSDEVVELSPAAAKKLIREGNPDHPIRVRGLLDLSNFKSKQLPDGLDLHCYDLDLRGSHLESLPDKLRIDSRLIADACRNLETLPENFSAGSISLRDCPSFTALPEGLDTWFLDLTGSQRFEQWPSHATINRGSLILRNCIGVRTLPDWLTNLAHLDVAGCAQLPDVPDGVKVSGWIDVGGSGLTGLPKSLEGVSLRWRSVPIDERIAFDPESLTAKEALAETNAEIRRVMIERMGYLRFAQEAGAKVLDEDTDPGGTRQLLKIDLDEDEPLVGLSCSCPSTQRQYLLRVPPSTNSCHDAAAWLAGYDDPSLYKPKIET
ncbi:MAG: DUF6745 domain-containing protein [Verrucomicrobiota bacterium]